jgi:hypothetical protein
MIRGPKLRHQNGRSYNFPSLRRLTEVGWICKRVRTRSKIMRNLHCWICSHTSRSLIIVIDHHSNLWLASKLVIMSTKPQGRSPAATPNPNREQLEQTPALSPMILPIDRPSRPLIRYIADQVEKAMHFGCPDDLSSDIVYKIKWKGCLFIQSCRRRESERPESWVANHGWFLNEVTPNRQSRGRGRVWICRYCDELGDVVIYRGSTWHCSKHLRQ